MKRALITGTTGQDGSCLAELPFDMGYQRDPRCDRSAEVDLCLGDAAKARETFGWEPQVGFGSERA